MEGGGGSPEPPSDAAADAASATARRKAAASGEQAAMGADDGGIADGRADVIGRYSFDPPLRSPNVKMSGPPEAPARAKK